ncbi:hypothetical protein BGW36DRAFT_333769 [Talaromyces proteolyticus]|uniref:NmrA-like domain-containing protein n=1 Tax=Talaromyces proteolyticus TaxID=1131652 RepID=A0AAD4L0A6_9EURO|nr:uncharacterized protein BGW36DRAFT_333769 [Talaromyces proteolyticus]KAH8703140.1 hypothetical protein BGW36DRAFT_333769 [Talaromyces proteolyticus]
MATSYAKDQPAGFKNRIENVAIVGAGGQCGKFIVDALLKKGHFRVTALTRHDSLNVIAEGVEVKKVDYNEPSTLVEALKGQDVLIVTLAVTATDEAEKLNVAAAEAGVPWVLPNEFGGNAANESADQDTMIGLAKKKIRDQIEQLGKSSWIGIACGFWYEYSLSCGLWSYGFDINNREVTFYDDGTQRMDTSTWNKTALGVASLLSLKVIPEDANDKATHLAQFKNKMVGISSFQVNQQEMFESLLRVTGTTRDEWKISSEPVKERFARGKQMLQTGDRNGFGILLYARMFYPDAPAIQLTNNNADLGLEQEDLDERTAEAVKMAKENYFEKVVIPRTGRRS